MKQVDPVSFVPMVRMCNYIQVPVGQVWGPREIPDFELIFIASGRYRYQSEQSDELLHPNDTLCIPPVEEHVLSRVDEQGESRISCVHLELSDVGSWAAGAYEFQPFPRLVTRHPQPEQLQECFRHCAQVYSGFSKYRDPLLRTAVKQVVLHLAEYWEPYARRRVSRRTREMIAFLRLHLDQSVSRRDLAEAFSLSPEHVNAIFKKELGVSPTEFVNRERTLTAYKLLHDEGYSVKEAAAEVGFCDQFYFSKLFKRYMGVTPNAVSWHRRRDASRPGFAW